MWKLTKNIKMNVKIYKKLIKWMWKLTKEMFKWMWKLTKNIKMNVKYNTKKCLNECES
jgi:hypothetical protein